MEKKGGENKMSIVLIMTDAELLSSEEKEEDGEKVNGRGRKRRGDQIEKDV